MLRITALGIDQIVCCMPTVPTFCLLSSWSSAKHVKLRAWRRGKKWRYQGGGVDGEPQYRGGQASPEVRCLHPGPPTCMHSPGMVPDDVTFRPQSISGTFLITEFKLLSSGQTLRVVDSAAV
jgi:hypothetical protein